MFVVAFALISVVVGPLLWVVRVALRPAASFEIRPVSAVAGRCTTSPMRGRSAASVTLVELDVGGRAGCRSCHGARVAGRGLAGYRFPGRA